MGDCYGARLGADGRVGVKSDNWRSAGEAHAGITTGHRSAGITITTATGLRYQSENWLWAARHQAIAVVLDLVDPAGARRRSLGSGREAGFDEAGRGARRGVES